MPSPVGHATAGLIIGAALGRRMPVSPRLLAGLAIWAAIADADIIVDALLGEPGRFHRYVTHSLLAVVIASAVVALILRWVKQQPFWRSFGILALTYGSHVVLDMFVVGPRDPVLGPTHPLGVPLFWPFAAIRVDAGPLVIRPDTLVTIELPILLIVCAVLFARSRLNR